MKTILLIIFFIQTASAASLSESLNKLGFNLNDLSSFNLTKETSRSGIKKNVTTLKFSKGTDNYILDISSPQSEKDFNKDRDNTFGIITNSYTDQPSPYQGELTSLIKCSKEFKPVLKDYVVGNKKLFLIQSLVNKDLNYGVCEKSQAQFKACTGFSHEPSKSQTLKLKVITSLKNDCFEINHGFFKQLKTI